MKNCFEISHNKEKYTKPIHFHSHDFYEIYFFMDGNVKYYIENESYTLAKGDVLIIPPGKLHRPVIEGNTPYDRYVLWIYNRYVSSNKGISCLMGEITAMIEEKNTRLISFEGSALKALTEMLDRLMGDSRSDGDISFYTAESRITLILSELLSCFRRTEKVHEEQEDTVQQVISYINRNVADAPSLEELSAKFFVSKYYLLRKFKEHTKTTIHRYILMKKINLAKELLEKGEPPNKVCEKCGFSTYSNFYKAFTDQTGTAPGNYVKHILK